jgi:hypothetical protein
VAEYLVNRRCEGGKERRKKIMIKVDVKLFQVARH